MANMLRAQGVALGWYAPPRWGDGNCLSPLFSFDFPMNDTNQKQLGNTLWKIADDLRGAMNADDFRDYMLSFLFLRYLSDNYEIAAKKELRKDYPGVSKPDGSRCSASIQADMVAETLTSPATSARRLVRRR